MIKLHPSITVNRFGEYRPQIMVRRSGQMKGSKCGNQAFADKETARNIARVAAYTVAASMRRDYPTLTIEVA